MSLKSLLPVLLLLSTSAFAANETSLTEQVASAPIERQPELLGEFIVSVPGQFRLGGTEFAVRAPGKFLGMSGARIGLGSALGNAGNWVFRSYFKTGYSYTEGTPLENADSSPAYQHWFPLEGTVQAEYRIDGMPFVQPLVLLGVGVHFLHQEGNFGNVAKNLWIPTFHSGVGLKFLDYRARGDWFGGFSFGVGFHGTMSQEHSVYGWSYTLSGALIL